MVQIAMMSWTIAAPVYVITNSTMIMQSDQAMVSLTRVSGALISRKSR